MQAAIDKQLPETEKTTALFEVVSVKDDVETVLDYKLLEDDTLDAIEDAMIETFDKLNVAEDDQDVVYVCKELEPSILFGNKRRIFTIAPKVANETTDELWFRVTTFSKNKQ